MGSPFQEQLTCHFDHLTDLEVERGRACLKDGHNAAFILALLDGPFFRFPSAAEVTLALDEQARLRHFEVAPLLTAGQMMEQVQRLRGFPLDAILGSATESFLATLVGLLIAYDNDSSTEPS